jgi:hypothetical protein
MVDLKASIAIPRNYEIFLATIDQNQILSPSQIFKDVLDNNSMILLGILLLSASHAEYIINILYIIILI